MFGGVTCMGTATAWLCGIRMARCLSTQQRGFASKFNDEDARLYEKQLKRYKRRSAKEQLDRMLKNNRSPEVDEKMWRAASNTRPRTPKQYRMHKRALNLWLRYQETTFRATQHDPWQEEPRTSRREPHSRARTHKNSSKQEEQQQEARRRQQHQDEAGREYMRGFHAYWQQFRGPGMEGDWEGWYDPGSDGSRGAWSFGRRFEGQAAWGPTQQRLPPVHLAALGLGVDVQLTSDSLKTAFKAAAVRWHPDRHHNAEASVKAAAEERFKAAQNAYDALKALV